VRYSSKMSVYNTYMLQLKLVLISFILWISVLVSTWTYETALGLVAFLSSLTVLTYFNTLLLKINGQFKYTVI